MTGDAWNIGLNIIASVITGSMVWISGRLLRLRRLRRKQAFLGLSSGGECLIVVPRMFSADNERSVHRNDAAAMLDLSAILSECGAKPEVIFHDQVYQGLAAKSEFCIGGPAANRRTEAHLRSVLPGVRMAGADERTAIDVGGQSYPSNLHHLEYALLAKVVRHERDKPAFVICGQTSIANRVAARYLDSEYPRLRSRYGVRRRFCVLLRVIESESYGPSVVEFVRDITTEAFSPRPAESSAQPG
ncbi:hypothetical protein E1202_05585 [Saccharopolyspora karakumensis]|uniref:Uncharacterized protein n=1 Tax=Saccharopolyspora karakumensis TaxID=2530386 RepID=A0A4R5BWR3_9PSEU|nr:hypothetical protein [Saccharopolyspora karakumensis]TDD91618.1 hypothetical protein E1202_05585 [Saccharopolyspora karakumensis]